MDENDRNNLDFLMALDSDGMRDWLANVDEDDVKYAFELLAEARLHIALRETELSVELNDHVEDVSQASEYLARFGIK
jgi:hypothetical protein